MQNEENKRLGVKIERRLIVSDFYPPVDNVRCPVHIRAEVLEMCSVLVRSVLIQASLNFMPNRALELAPAFKYEPNLSDWRVLINLRVG
jgi:hypothetical protein